MLDELTNLFAVVAVQALFAGVLWAWRRPRKPELLKIVALGITIGLFFDLAIGRGWRIFDYGGREASPAFVTLNALFSYGIATLTAWLLPVELVRRPAAVRAGAAMAVLALIVLTLGELLAPVFGPLLRMSVAGGATVLLAEAAAAALGCRGPVSSAVGMNGWPAARLLACSVVAGVLYELANHFFPLWRWAVAAVYPSWLVEFLVIGFGYFVMFHVMWIGSRLVAGEPR